MVTLSPAMMRTRFCRNRALAYASTLAPFAVETRNCVLRSTSSTIPTMVSSASLSINQYEAAGAFRRLLFARHVGEQRHSVVESPTAKARLASANSLPAGHTGVYKG